MSDLPPDPLLQALCPRPTGNVLVAFKPDIEPGKVTDLMRRMGVLVRSSQAPPGATPTPDSPPDFRATAISSLLAEGHATVFEQLNIAVIPARQGAAGAMAMAMAEDDNVMLARPEFYMFAISLPPAFSRPTLDENPGDRRFMPHRASIFFLVIDLYDTITGCVRVSGFSLMRQMQPSCRSVDHQVRRLRQASPTQPSRPGAPKRLGATKPY